MSLPIFPEHKKSGIAWIGEIPLHWNVCPLRWLLSRNDGGVWGEDADGVNDTVVLRSTEQSANGTWKIEDPAVRRLTVTERRETLLLAGDLLLTKSSGSALHIGKTTLVTPAIEELGCSFSNFMQRLRPSAFFDSRFAWYLLNNEVARSQFDYLSNSTTGLANLSASLINQTMVCFPERNEQRAIADFLDHEVAKLDKLIGLQEELVSLLKEKRQALISHAVTKGLDPNAPMKDSGIKWLGEVPANWNVRRLKFVATVQSGIAKGKDHSGIETVSVPYLRVANVQNGYLDLTDVAEIEVPAVDVARYTLQAGDVLMNEGGDFDKLGRGAIWHSEIETCVHQNHVFAVRPHSVKSSWLDAITNSDYAQFYFMARSKQSTNLASISSSNLMELPIVMPPDAEQDQILDFIAEQSRRIDTLVVEAQRAIDLLAERRSALISAAVTGKIDVRKLVTEAA